MITVHLRSKEASLAVLKYLKKNEPKCSPCEHCIFYLKDKECEEQQEKIRQEHKTWEEKVKKWKRGIDGYEI